MNTDKKYTIIVSAFRECYSDLDNFLATEKLASWIIERAHVDYERAVGVYKGAAELSFVIHTNSSNVVSNIRTHCTYELGQDCVLVSNNRQGMVELHNSLQGAGVIKIGKRFVKYNRPPMNAQAYTVLNGTDYYVVE